VIGHRRLAAAKLAGLEKVPCNVAEMTEQEQISTMLLENMQRNDLTVYEQAQGFQMMLDLGETEQSIAEKTGFSKKTVKHRLKLLELDPEEFKKAEEKGATLDDYIELEKIHDKELKNKALKEIGTQNFQWKVQNAINEEKREINKAMWESYLNRKLEKVEYTRDREFLSKYPYIQTSELTDEKKEEIEKLIEIQKETCPNKPEVYYMQDCYGYIYIVGKMKDKSAEIEQQRKYDAQQELYRRRKERIAPIEEQAQQLREKFISSWEGDKKELELIVCEYLASPYILNYSEVDYEELANRMGLNDIIDPDEEDEVDEDTEPHERLANSPAYLDAVAKKPQKVMLYLLANEYEGGNTLCCHDYFGNHVKNSKLVRWYNTLRRLGYRMSSYEQALLDGTHECFKDEENENA
jgi:ParB family chromosome partitioning protein